MGVWIGAVNGYFCNKDCHFDTKNGASRMASPHVPQPEPFRLGRARIWWRELTERTENCFSCIFPCKSVGNLRRSFGLRRPPFRSTCRESLFRFLRKVAHNFLYFDTVGIVKVIFDVFTKKFFSWSGIKSWLCFARHPPWVFCLPIYRFYVFYASYFVTGEIIFTVFNFDNSVFPTCWWMSLF